VALKRTTDDRLNNLLFGMRGYPVRAGGDRTIDPRKVSQFLVFLNHPEADHQFKVLGAVAEGVFAFVVND
jgi:hypothetical protein